MNMQSSSNLPTMCPQAAQTRHVTQAQCLSSIAGAPAGYCVRHARQGSFLVLVIGTLALLAVITIVYVALGNQDSRTRSAVLRRVELDDVPAGVAEYHAEVLARDIFSMNIDGSMVQPYDPNRPTNVEGALHREMDDAPGVAHDPNNPGGRPTSFVLRSDGRLGVDPRLLFTPWGGLHDSFIQDFVSNSGVRQDYALGGPEESFRLLGSDPFLASSTPTYLNFNASLQDRANLKQNDFVDQSYVDAPYMQQLDWYSITNVAPDGRFVNLDNLRNNFNAPSDSSAPTISGGPAGMGYGKTLLRLNNPRSSDLTFSATTETDWGFQPPLVATGTEPAMDDAPFYWTMRQQGAFMPARVSLQFANEPVENPARNSPNNPFDRSVFKGYQWADADGDGMLDSRWWEMAVSEPRDGDLELPKFAGNMRWFFASRIVDLSGRINVNYAGDLVASPAETLAYYQGANLRDLPSNLVMPLGLSPGDIDLRRILMQIDSFANYNADGTGSVNAAYDRLINGGPYDNYNETKAMLAGSLAYASQRFANYSGIVVGLDPIGDVTQSIMNGVDLQDVQNFSTNIANPPQLSGFLKFVDEELNVGVANNFDAMGKRPWQSMMFPTRPWLRDSTTGAILAMPPFGSPSAGAFNGWINWPARRTINYLAQSRKLWNNSTDSLSLRDSNKLRFGIQDMAELLERNTVNNPNVTSPLEVVMGARDFTLGRSDALLDVLRSNRSVEDETTTYDAVTDAAAANATRNDGAMRSALRRLRTDVRSLLTSVSGSRPLRTVASTNPQSLSQNEVKINAREALDLPPRPSDGLKIDFPPKPPKVESAESAARIFFEGYVEGLAPYASLDAAWDRNDSDFNRVRTLFYGYRGAELALLTSATMAVNMIDLADGPTPAPLMYGPQQYNAQVGNGPRQLPVQLQAVRPGVSDPRNKPTIRTTILSDEILSSDLDDLTRQNNNNAPNVPGQPDALGALFPTWQAADDMEQPPTGVVKALDNLDISGAGKLAPANDDVITPVVNVIGIEPQVFLTQVTTMTVYYDNYIADPDGYNSAGNPDTVKLAEPNVINPTPSPTGNQIFDGATVNNTEVLFKLVAFKLTNPFDRDVILGKPMFSDIPPNSVVGLTGGVEMMPDSPLELVVDASIPRSVPFLNPNNLGPNTDEYFPYRADRLPIFSRKNRWAVGSQILSNATGLPAAITGGTSGNWRDPNDGGVLGAYGRGDQIDVASDAFRTQTSFPIDHMSDFNYIRFGSRTYMLMSLNEQWYHAKDTTQPPQYTLMDRRVKKYRLYDRPDALTPTVPPNDAVSDRGIYVDADTSVAGRQVAITLNPIIVPAGKTIVAYALSEAPNRILANLADRNPPTGPGFGLDTLQTPAGYADDELADNQPYLDLATFMKRVIERQISAGSLRMVVDPANPDMIDNSNPDFATTIFNPNGAYWIPMIWEGTPGQPTPPNIGFTPSRLQDLGAYVNPIPKEAAIDVDNDGTITPLENRAQRTATLWRTVRQNPTNEPGSMFESQWRNVPSSTPINLDTDWAGTPLATLPPSARRSLVANGGPWILNSNDYRNDQMQDRLRIPARLDMSVALKHQVNSVGSNVPIELEGTNVVDPPTGNQDKDGYTIALWSSVRRPSDPRSARVMLGAGGINVPNGYEFLYDVPDDILPGYCLEAKYWEDHGQELSNPATPGYPMNVVSAWNLISESQPWAEYRRAAFVNDSDPVVFTTAMVDKYFRVGELYGGDSFFWHGGAPSMRRWLSEMHGFELGTASRLPNFELEDPAFKEFDIASNPLGVLSPQKSTSLSAAPQRITAAGYAPTSGPRTLRGTIDQKPNASVDGLNISENTGGPFDLLNSYRDTARLLSGRLTYAELTPQVTQDADRERGNQSNNFYRDVDMRTPLGYSSQQNAGNPEDFDENSHYTRWVSTLRSADLLRPLGVGPLESPARWNGSQLVLRGNFLPSATFANDIKNNNARYTTLGEALACALGYENRDFENTANRIYQNQAEEDINLLRSPYRLPTETGNAARIFHLKKPPGALVGGATSGTLQAGDDSALTLLFDRGNLWTDRFVPYVEATNAAAQDCVMDLSEAEFTVGPGLPAAQLALEQFETPPADPQELDAVGADNKPGLNVVRQGQVNVNTAPVEVLRALPGLSPRPYVIPQSLPGAGNPRPSTFGNVGNQPLGDVNWFAGVNNVRPILPINQNTDIAAGIAAYRDMTPVLMSRSAMESIKLSAPNRGGTYANTEPVGVPFLTPDANNLQADPFFNVRHLPEETNQFSSNTQIPGINKTPGLRSTAELLSVRSRALTERRTYVSRWPSGDFNGTAPISVKPRYDRWKSAPWSMDQLGYDVNPTNVTTPAITENLNSSFGEIDGASGRSEYAFRAIDNPYDGIPVASTTPNASAARNVASEAIRGIANEYDEQLIAANNVMNTVTNRSDLYAVWFVAAGFQRSDVEGIDDDEALIPSVQRRFLMIVDRSNVVNKGEKPRILLMKEVPMDSNVQ